MASDDEFRIKGAAQTSDVPPPASSEPEEQSEEQSEHADHTEEAEEAHSKNRTMTEEVVEEDQKQEEDEVEEKEEGEEEEESEETKNLSRYKWFKCENPSQTPDTPAHYYTNTETGASSWEEPQEPYWVYNIELGGPDPCGLQYPAGVERPGAEQTLAETNPLQYNPKIHGNYDPNADYAKYTSQRLAQQSGGATTALTTMPGHTADYTAIMALNARTGSTQPSHLTADRHTDAAKSGRQMNAFFDVDAAANAHEGKSLKEERKAKKLSKAEVKAFNEARKEKKQKKRMAFYKS